MNRHTSRKHAALYLKQGILSLILLALTVYLGSIFSLRETLFPPKVAHISDLVSNSDSTSNSIVKLHCDKLYYTGYDNRSDKSITGHYYYTIQDGCCIFFLLENNTGGQPEEILKNYTGTVRITQDEEVFNRLISMISKDMNWSSESLKNISLPLIASQPDYHPVSAILFVLLFFLCLLIFLFSILYNFYHYYTQRAPHNESAPHGKNKV